MVAFNYGVLHDGACDLHDDDDFSLCGVLQLMRGRVVVVSMMHPRLVKTLMVCQLPFLFISLLNSYNIV
jgi:hypothetical protein